MNGLFGAVLTFVVWVALPKIASEVLARWTVVITVDLYSHVTESMRRQALGAMDTLLAGD